MTVSYFLYTNEVSMLFVESSTSTSLRIVSSGALIYIDRSSLEESVSFDTNKTVSGSTLIRS